MKPILLRNGWYAVAFFLSCESQELISFVHRYITDYCASLCEHKTDQYGTKLSCSNYLRGIERFYLYDFENSKDLAALLAPWIEAGIVVHHTMTYEDPSIPSANFMSRATHHFSTNYAKSIEWTFFFDVDEYINLSTVYNAHPTPWRENGEWHYPLQEIMRWPSDRGARCVELSRSGVFLNVGQIEHTPRTSVIERHFYREQRNRITQPGKVIESCCSSYTRAVIECVTFNSPSSAARVTVYWPSG